MEGNFKAASVSIDFATRASRRPMRPVTPNLIRFGIGEPNVMQSLPGDQTIRDSRECIDSGWRVVADVQRNMTILLVARAV